MNVADCPAVTVWSVGFVVTMGAVLKGIAAAMVVGSLAVLFPLLISLLPSTLTLLVTEAGASAATLTVSVIGG